MANANRAPLFILRRRDLEDRLKLSRSTIYDKINPGFAPLRRRLPKADSPGQRLGRRLDRRRGRGVGPRPNRVKPQARLSPPMAQRLPNPRLAKTHRSYTVEEVARLFGVHRNTVRHWIKQGLPVCDDRRPTLILGKPLADFLTRRRLANKRPCKPGEMYCVRCRSPQAPALGMADYQPLTATGGNLIGLCSRCEGTMYRRVNIHHLSAARGGLEVRFTQGREHIAESSAPSLNCDSGPGE